VHHDHVAGLGPEQQLVRVRPRHLVAGGRGGDAEVRPRHHAQRPRVRGHVLPVTRLTPGPGVAGAGRAAERESARRGPQSCLLEPRRQTKIVQGWPKLWANFRALIGIFSQTVGPSLAFWANLYNFRSIGSHLQSN
jgi:hypothetical protein